MMRRCVVLAVGSVVMAGAARSEDVLVIRDGTRRQGVVAGCRDDACTLDGARVARGLIGWVGLRQGGAAPPRARDPLKDEAHLTDGRVVTGEFGGLSLGAVAIGDSSFDREEVAWIRFVGPEPAPTAGPSPSGPVYRFSPSPPAPSSPQPPSLLPSPLPSPSPPPPPGLTPGFAGVQGALWTGTLNSRMWLTPQAGGITSESTSSFSLRLRETRYPLMAPVSGKWSEVGSITSLRNEGSTVTTRGTHTSGLDRCWGDGTATLAPLVVGWLHLKSRDVDLTPQLGFDFPRAGGRYEFKTYNLASYPWTCQTQGFPARRVGDQHHPVIEVGHLDPRENREGLDPEVRGLVQGRMQGSYTTSDPSMHNVTATWMLCREGTACPSAPPPAGGGSPSPSPDPCGNLDAARSLVDVLWDQRQSMTPALERAWRDLKSAHDEMLFNVEAWRAAVDVCAIAEIVQTVLTEAAGAFGEALDLAAQIAEGDLSYLNQSDEVSAALEVLGGASAAAGAGNPANMRDHLAGCSALPQNLRAGARAFVDNYESVLRLMPQVQEHINHIRQKDQQHWDEWNRYYQVCLEYARCKGLPPSTCPPPPASPSGPMPRESP